MNDGLGGIGGFVFFWGTLFSDSLVSRESDDCCCNGLLLSAVIFPNSVVPLAFVDSFWFGLISWLSSLSRSTWFGVVSLYRLSETSSVIPCCGLSPFWTVSGSTKVCWGKVAWRTAVINEEDNGGPGPVTGLNSMVSGSISRSCDDRCGFRPGMSPLQCWAFCPVVWLAEKVVGSTGVGLGRKISEGWWTSNSYFLVSGIAGVKWLAREGFSFRVFGVALSFSLLSLDSGAFFLSTPTLMSLKEGCLFSESELFSAKK